MRPLALSVAFVVAGCTRPTPEPARADAYDASVPHAASSPLGGAEASTDATPKEAESSYCTKTSECGWDDDCIPHRCVARSPKPRECDKSLPSLGDCRCIEATCTYVRTKPEATGSCAKDDECEFDPATGLCRPGSPPAAPIFEEGSFCRCVAKSCAVERVEPVPCKTALDCSWLEDPRRPAPASKVPRPWPPVKTPCASSSFDAVCKAGRCRLVAWKC